MAHEVALYIDEFLAGYGFPDGHPWGVDRQQAFWSEARAQGLDRDVLICPSRLATVAEVSRFHTSEHVARVQHLSLTGYGSIDGGDTPAFSGVYEASAHVVGAALEGLSLVMAGEVLRSFQPIGGLHHATREHAAGFCVFNDCGVVIDTLRSCYGIERIAYVDIDVHHGDGLYYPYAADPHLIYADIHEDGRFLYPGTGAESERGKAEGLGLKLNIPMPPAADDQQFRQVWAQVEAHLIAHQPEFIIFQAGADSIAGDPLAHLSYTPAVHAYAAKRLCALANRFCEGRIMGFGGGGYNRQNLALGWCGVLNAFIKASEQ
jgi:acetoin utilization protein AcuC